jgi:type II secretory pathway component GspD/PulD (secretin)
LISNGDGTLLASPSLICLEGKPGQFFVGDEIRYVTQISVATNGAPTVTTDTANIGVQLSVVGSVSEDGNITLNLHPEVSTLKLDERMRSEAGITLPVITRRFTDHVVRVNNGDTIVIGGLILDSELDSLRKVPLLGDIPLFGHLFRHRDKTKERSEVVVFITASIVED